MMEVDIQKSEESTNEYDSSGTSNTLALIHPLVVLNISEHLMRDKVGSNNLTCGVLLGKQKNCDIEIKSSMEILVSSETNEVDEAYIQTRLQLSKSVNRDLDLVGCYSVQSTLGVRDYRICKELKKYAEFLIVLKLDGDSLMGNGKDSDGLPIVVSSLAGDSLPIKLYETVTLSNSEVKLRRIKYVITSEETESIGVKHVSRGITTTNQNSSVVLDQLQPQQQALQMLKSRLEFLILYLQSVSDKTIPANMEIISSINNLVLQLPSNQQEGVASSNNPEFHKELFSQANDVCLTTLLCSLCQSLDTVQEMGHKQGIIDRDISNVTPRCGSKPTGILMARYRSDAQQSKVFNSGMPT